jgi:hypothetical protein
LGAGAGTTYAVLEDAEDVEDFSPFFLPTQQQQRNTIKPIMSTPMSPPTMPPMRALFDDEFVVFVSTPSLVVDPVTSPPMVVVPVTSPSLVAVVGAVVVWHCVPSVLHLPDAVNPLIRLGNVSPLLSQSKSVPSHAVVYAHVLLSHVVMSNLSSEHFAPEIPFPISILVPDTPTLSVE